MTGSRRCEVAVVGAGPAGAVTACLLARAGRDVVLLEKEVQPREKVCGGGVVGRAIRCLPEGVCFPRERSCVAVELHLPQDSLAFRAVRAEPIISMTRRADFDAALVRAAQAAGAELRSPYEVTAVENGNGIVTIRGGGSCVEARFVVAGDGAKSSVARLAGFKPQCRLVPAMDWEIPRVSEDQASSMPAARFDLGWTEKGYTWVFPKERTLSAGIVGDSQGKRDLRPALVRYLEVLGLSGRPGTQCRGHVIPSGPRPGGAARGRVLLAGDAAGLVDSLTWEGISFAIRSGRLVAQSLVEGGFDPAKVADFYAAGVRRTILPELRWARRLEVLVHNLPGFRTFLFRRIGQHLCDLMAAVMAGEHTYAELLGSPGNYWRLFRECLWRRIR